MCLVSAQLKQKIKIKKSITTKSLKKTSKKKLGPRQKFKINQQLLENFFKRKKIYLSRV